MNVSPLDLRQQRFHTRFRGFDKIEVTSFLDRGRRRLRAGAARNRPAAPGPDAAWKPCSAEHREHEKSLQSTLITAQKLADDIKAATPKKRPIAIIREAAGRSELLLEKTQARLEDVQREIDGLKLKRRDVETTIEATIQTLRNTLEFVREQDRASATRRSCSTARATRSVRRQPAAGRQRPQRGSASGF